jgi:nicotinamidase-related amidase
MLEPVREVLSNNGVISVRPLAMPVRPPGTACPLLLAPERAAVIVVDVQRHFTEAPAFSAMRQIVPRIAGFLPLARAAGMTVVHLKTEFCANMVDAGRPGSRTRQMMMGLGGNSESENPLVKGHPATDIVPELAPQSPDLVVIKTRFSGFWATNLNEVLRVATSRR